MERIVNSVTQIVGECRNMIAQTDSCEYIDVKGLAKTLSEECADLEEFYNKYPDKERELNIKKTHVEETAIRLEFYMDARLGLYKERRRLRKTAEKIFEELEQVMYAKSSSDDKEEILLIGVRMKWALNFLSRSNHVIFEKDENDEKEMSLIRDILNKEGNIYA